MAKKIDGLRKQIIESTQEIIAESGYETLSMRKLSKMLGIAVGTLYNYYPNKQALLLEVLESSWQETFKKIEQINEGDQDAVEKFISILYDDIANRKGLGQILISTDVSGSSVKNIRGIFDHLEENLTKILMEKNIDYPRKKAISMLITLSQLHQRFPNEREDNIRFILT
jgi:AcrR family transcriptional regulator